MKTPALLLQQSLKLAIAATVLIFGILIAPRAFAAPPDQLNNFSFEQDGGTPASAFDWQTFGDGYERSQEQVYTGEWGLKLLRAVDSGFSGAYQRVDLQQTELKPVLITSYVKGQDIVGAPNSNFGAGLYAEIHLQDGSVAYWNSVGNFGTFDWRYIGFNTGNIYSPTGVPLVQQPIDYIFVVAILGNASGTAFFDDLTFTEFEPAQAAVTLMFDDGTITDYSVAKPILDGYELAGTSAIVTGEIGDAGSMSASQIQELYANGWEIQSHTTSHGDLTLLTAEQLTAQLTTSKDTLQQLGIEAVNLALPFGAYNGQVLGESQKYYRSTRAFELGDNSQGVFQSDVKVRSVVASTTVAEVNQWLDQAKQDNRWVVLVFHTLTATGDDAYHTDPAVFAQMVEAVVASELPAVTYNQGLTRFATPY